MSPGSLVPTVGSEDHLALIMRARYGSRCELVVRWLILGHDHTPVCACEHGCVPVRIRSEYYINIVHKESCREQCTSEVQVYMPPVVLSELCTHAITEWGTQLTAQAKPPPTSSLPSCRSECLTIHYIKLNRCQDSTWAHSRNSESTPNIVARLDIP